MATNSFDGIFYIKKVPTIRYEDGLFFICYDVGKIHAEFVMQPSVYLKALRAAGRAAKQFHDRDGSVSDIKSRFGH